MFNVVSPHRSLLLECPRSYDQIEAYRMLTHKELREYCHDRFLVSTSYDGCVGDTERLGRLVLKLSSLAEFDTNIIEEIFFVGLIGKMNHMSYSNVAA
jgi:hypothetical protein